MSDPSTTGMRRIETGERNRRESDAQQSRTAKEGSPDDATLTVSFECQGRAGSITYTGQAASSTPNPTKVDHWTPSPHWCAGWHWVVDCEHLLNLLPVEHDVVDYCWTQSLAYDRKTQCMEVRFKWQWHNVHQ